MDAVSSTADKKTLNQISGPTLKATRNLKTLTDSGDQVRGNYKERLGLLKLCTKLYNLLHFLKHQYSKKLVNPTNY